MRKVHHHGIKLPEEYEGFLLVNGLQLSERETKALLNFTHGCIKPPSIKSWLRKNETSLSASELGADRKKASSISLVEKEAHSLGPMDGDDSGASEEEELREIEAFITDLQTEENPETEGILTEAEAAEVLSTYVQQRKSYTQSIKNKKTRELARGYGDRNNRRFNGGFRDGRRNLSSSTSQETLATLKRRTRCDRCQQIGHWKRECRNQPARPGDGSMKGGNEAHFLENTEEAFFVGYIMEEGAKDTSERTLGRA